MKYITKKIIPQLSNEIGDIVDIFDESGGEAVDKAISDGVLELCKDQTLQNKHFLALLKPQKIKLTTLQPN